MWSFSLSHSTRRLRSARLSRLVFGPVAIATAAGLIGCSESGIVATEPPTGVNNPNTFNTPAGAVSIYYGAISAFRMATTSSNGSQGNGQGFVASSGLLSDELTSGENATGYPIFGDNGITINALIDSRNENGTETGSSLPFASATPWTKLHAVRIGAMTAIRALRRYAPDSPKDRIGHAFALWGLSEVMLADLFCSGIPLSSVDSLGVTQYSDGLSTQDVLAHAVTLFDSALVYTTDSVTYRYLAQVGKGWALLDAADYVGAAAAVQGVPTDFVYENLHAVNSTSLNMANWTRFDSGLPIGSGPGVVADRDGGTGLPYRSSNDPRVPLVDLGPDIFYFNTFAFAFAPLVTPSVGAGSARIASGIEARLIEAEAALQANDVDGWLSQLNALRTTCTDAGSCQSPAPAGTGNVAGLPPLDDPSTADGRVTLMFQERAYWLFLTGRRLGDMRRLIRQYHRPAAAVFPVGPYPISAITLFGPDLNLTPPIGEQKNNPLYHGCINHDA